MKKHFLLFYFLFLLFKINAQSLDSINYVSNFEMKIFEKVDSLNTNDSYFELLFAIDSTTNYKEANEVKKRVDNFISSIVLKKFNRYSNKKKIKYLFKKIHNRFLVKYEDVANFNLIFKNGTYNCVSASALYAYIFDSLNIPYQIKETPTHIFLVAYPNESNIYIETTIPGNNGFYSPTDNDIEKAVLELIKAKLITKSEVDNIGYKKAYMDFYYDKEFLQPLELIGVQYYNEGIMALQNENYEKAYLNFRKAENFYKTKKVKYLKISCLSLVLSKSNYTENKDIKNIIILLNTLEYQKDYLEKDLRYYLANIITANKNNEKFLINATEKFNSLDNNEVKNIFNKELYKFIAEDRFLLDKNLDDILFYALKSYNINKDDKAVQNLISNAILKSFFYITPNKKSVSKIEAYEKEYPFLKNSNFYKKYMIRIYSYMTNQYYYKKEPNVGEVYFNKLKKVIAIAKKDKIELDQELIGNAYWSIGAFYYGKSNLKKAKEILDEGKKISPEHHKLNKILGYVNDDLK